MRLKDLFENYDSTIKNLAKDYKSGDFYCNDNQLTSLEYCPTQISGDFNCFRNKLTSLEHCPTQISGDFYCYANQLTSLEHCPTSVSDFNCSGNKLTSLEHCPTQISGDFYCYGNQLTSLVGIGRKYLKQVKGKIDLEDNPIKSNVLGLLLIKDLKLVNMDNRKVQKIINIHLSGDRDIMECQEELIQAGLREFARL